MVYSCISLPLRQFWWWWQFLLSISPCVHSQMGLQLYPHDQRASFTSVPACFQWQLCVEFKNTSHFLWFSSNFDSKQLPPSSIICFQSNFLGHRRANSWTISFGPLTVEPLCPGTIQWTSLTSSGLPPYSLQCEPQPRGGLSSSNFSLIWILSPTTPKVFFFSVYFFLVHSPLFQSLINNYFH